MTVAELIERLKQMPQNVNVYAEGEFADKVIFEKSPDGNGGIVRIFKAWDVVFVGRGAEPQEIHCNCTDEEIAKSFIEDAEAVKDQLPCGEQMDFPSTFDEFAEDYGFKDKDEIYTNGSELIPVFRVKQWLEHDQKVGNKE